MNLRKKNKKLKRELESARRQLEFDKIFIEQARRTAWEAKAYTNKRFGDIDTLQAYCHSPSYTMVSEEELKAMVVKQMIPELAKRITLENYIPRGGVPNAEYVLASIRVVKPR